MKTSAPTKPRFRVVLADGNIVLGEYRLQRDAVAAASDLNEAYSEYRRKYALGGSGWIAFVSRVEV